MTRNKVFSVAAIVLSVIAPVTLYASDFVTCESPGDYKHCSARNTLNSEIILYNQLSRSDCEKGRSWGVDSRGIWVDRGCRAKFEIRAHYDRDRGYDRYDDRYSYDRHDDYRRSDTYDSRYDRYDSLADERRRIEHEKDKLEREREHLEQQRRELASKPPQPPPPPQASCPPNTRPGRCSDKQRKHGCKDYRINPELVCFTG